MNDGRSADRETGFIGRDTELARVSGARREASCGMLLVGDPGVGKTALAEEVGRRAADEGRGVERALPSSGTKSMPMVALAHLAGRFADRPSEVAPELDAIQRITDSLRTRFDGSATLVIVDDANHLDVSSGVVLRTLALEGHCELIVTLRTGEELVSPLDQLLREGRLARLEIEPFGRDQLHDFAEAHLGIPLAEQSVRVLERLSEGNPLLASELLVAASSADLIDRDGGVLRLERDFLDALATTPRLVDLVRSRLGALDPEMISTLELIAVGEPLGLADARVLVGEGTLEALDAQRLVSLDTDGRRTRIVLAHPLYGEVIRRTLPDLRASQLRTRLAELFESYGSRRREDALRIAQWRLDAGTATDPEVLWIGAQLARMAEDHETTRVLASQVMQARPDFAPGYLLGEVCFELGLFAESADWLRRVLDLALSDKERVLAAGSLMAALFWGLGWYEECNDLATKTEETLADEVWVADLRGRKAFFDVFTTELEAAGRVADELSEAAQPRLRIHAALVGGLHATLTGRIDEALEQCENGFGLGLQQIDGDDEGVPHPGTHLITKGLALSEAGRFEEAELLSEFGIETATESGHPMGQIFFALDLARVRSYQGRSRSALEWSREAASVARQHGNLGPVRWALGGVAMAALFLRDFEEAEQAVEEAERYESPAVMMDPDLARGRAWLAGRHGRIDETITRLHEAAEVAAERGAHLHEFCALYDCVRFGRSVTVADRLEELAATSGSPFMVLRAEHARASAVRSADGLADVGRALGDLGALGLAAEALAEAASVLRSDRNPRLATAVARDATAHLDRCDHEYPLVPALVSLAEPEPLTAREREIAGLISQGLTSRKIASQLDLSARTVDNHAANICRKLGVTHRREIAAALDLDHG